MAITCPNCNTSLPDTAKFCMTCGTPLEPNNTSTLDAIPRLTKPKSVEQAETIQQRLRTQAFLDAISNADLATVEEMLRKDVNLANVRDNTIDRQPALTYAAWIYDPNDQYEMVRLLLTYGADPNVAGEKKKSTPLHVAVTRSMTRAILEPTGSVEAAEAVTLLLQHGANPNAQDAKGNTPLHDAIRGNGILVMGLCGWGADPRIANNKGETPLALAEKSMSKETAPFEGKSDLVIRMEFNMRNVVEALRKAAGIPVDEEEA